MSTIQFKSMFSSFSVNDLDKAHDFYTNALDLDVTSEEMGILSLRQKAGSEAVMVYPKPDHQAATFTVLNLAVDDIEAAVDALSEKGVVFEQYDTDDIKTDAKGISRGEEGPAIAWFKDPAGNIMSVLERGPGK
jgi:predicted enzyme related to lactoylglutathione lyase